MSTTPSQPENAPILLLIDIQHGLVEGLAEWGPRSTPNLAKNVQYLLKIWRSWSWPILHVIHDDKDDPTNIISAAYPETFKPHACAKPVDDEKIFIKHVGSPFVATELASSIDTYGKDRKVVVIGMDGAQCINSTTRHGADLGYNMVVVGDACSTYGMQNWQTGKNVSAEETHEAAMSMLNAYGKVTTTKDVLSVLGFQ
ncbi:Isochorismatase-like protein [Gymnopilus junonius]|uniref:Isochorismatase-like protein n=1 Tax=Gymnopilus junonius TaxID=109634 RepID=A0A9P5P0J4_GYMJU|nr:Isochorismatase-like protein [Gymnopilus junonius]